MKLTEQDLQMIRFIFSDVLNARHENVQSWLTDSNLDQDQIDTLVKFCDWIADHELEYLILGYNVEKDLRKIKYSCDIMEVEKFMELCKKGSFIDYDGFGYFSPDKINQDIVVMVNPSDTMKENFNPNKYMYIVWYNK